MEKSCNHPILKFGNKSIDVQSFADIAGERWIDNFVVDISIANYIQDAQEQEIDNTLYFPTKVFDWLKSTSEDYQRKMVTKISSQMSQVNTLELVIIRVHMGNDWGLTVVDLVNEKLMFDDGLQRPAPQSTLPNVQKVMDLLVKLYLLAPVLQSQF